MPQAQAPIPGSAPTLRDLRKQAGITQQELAEAASCDQGYLSRVERGISTPSRRFLEHISRTLAELAGRAS